MRDYNLNKIEIITASGEILLLRMGMIIELNVFEDIESSALTGSLMIDSVILYQMHITTRY